MTSIASILFMAWITLVRQNRSPPEVYHCKVSAAAGFIVSFFSFLFFLNPRLKLPSFQDWKRVLTRWHWRPWKASLIWIPRRACVTLLWGLAVSRPWMLPPVYCQGWCSRFICSLAMQLCGFCVRTCWKHERLLNLFVLKAGQEFDLALNPSVRKLWWSWILYVNYC